jgi:hypothetical protein
LEEAKDEALNEAISHDPDDNMVVKVQDHEQLEDIKERPKALDVVNSSPSPMSNPTTNANNT